MQAITRIVQATQKSRIGLILTALVLGVVLSLTSLQPANAATAYTVSGKVKCANSEAQGVWVTANNGGSGFANTWINTADTFGTLRYSKKLSKGGSYYLGVGCGRTMSGSWAMTAYSNTYSRGTLNLMCNDIPWYLAVLSIRYPYIGSSLNPAVPYGRCMSI